MVSKRRFFIVFIIVVFLAAAICFVTTQDMTWDGRFAQGEYQLTFVDGTGTPLDGVQLQVEDLDGNIYYHYPITDYLAARIPKTDTSGTITFHHVSDYLEFGGRCTRLFGGFSFGDCKSPAFICRFLLHGNEVYRCSFDELNRSARQSGTELKRRWDWAENMPWPVDQKVTEQLVEDCRRACDHDQNGKFNMIEGAQWHRFEDDMQKLEDAQNGRPLASEDLDFALVVAKVVVPLR